ncbi:MAG: hypothetical protein ABEI52_09470, partial [Halobacteriaceae archaeon]
LAADAASDRALALLFLQAGKFVPRDKWTFSALGAVDLATRDVRELAWEAMRVVDRNADDLHRRTRALKGLWRAIKPALVDQDLIDAEAFTWEAPPAEICLIDDG